PGCSSCVDATMFPGSLRHMTFIESTIRAQSTIPITIIITTTTTMTPTAGPATPVALVAGILIARKPARVARPGTQPVVLSPARRMLSTADTLADPWDTRVGAAQGMVAVSPQAAGGTVAALPRPEAATQVEQGMSAAGLAVAQVSQRAIAAVPAARPA